MCGKYKSLSRLTFFLCGWISINNIQSNLLGINSVWFLCVIFCIQTVLWDSGQKSNQQILKCHRTPEGKVASSAHFPIYQVQRLQETSSHITSSCQVHRHQSHCADGANPTRHMSIFLSEHWHVGAVVCAGVLNQHMQLESSAGGLGFKSHSGRKHVARIKVCKK